MTAKLKARRVEQNTTVTSLAERVIALCHADIAVSAEHETRERAFAYYMIRCAEAFHEPVNESSLPWYKV